MTNLQTTNLIANEILTATCVNYLQSVSSDLLSLVQYSMITENEYSLLVDMAENKLNNLKQNIA